MYTRILILVCKKIEVKNDLQKVIIVLPDKRYRRKLRNAGIQLCHVLLQ